MRDNIQDHRDDEPDDSAGTTIDVGDLSAPALDLSHLQTLGSGRRRGLDLGDARALAKQMERAGWVKGKYSRRGRLSQFALVVSITAVVLTHGCGPSSAPQNANPSSSPVQAPASSGGPVQATSPPAPSATATPEPPPGPPLKDALAQESAAANKQAERLSAEIAEEQKHIEEAINAAKASAASSQQQFADLEQKLVTLRARRAELQKIREEAEATTRRNQRAAEIAAQAIKASEDTLKKLQSPVPPAPTTPAASPTPRPRVLPQTGSTQPVRRDNQAVAKAPDKIKASAPVPKL